MKSSSQIYDSFPSTIVKRSLIITVTVYLFIVLVNFFVIKKFNSSHFTYTIDDPYIHLSLAENIKHFHYGINKEEYSSPSSSIIYSLLFVPFIDYDFAVYLPLVVNVICSVGILFIFWKLLTQIYSVYDLSDKKKLYVISVLLSLTILTGNLVYSTFRGMEHSFQTLTAITMLWGIIKFIQDKRISWTFYLAAIISPLVRYENLALTFLLLLFLFIHKQKQTLFFGIIIIVLLLGYSLFLVQLGLEPLPLSVLKKSSLAYYDFAGLFLNQSTFILLIILFLYFNYLRILKDKNSEKILAGILSLLIIIHIALGMSGRYTEYLITSALFVLIFLYRDFLIPFFNQKPAKKIILISTIIILIFYKQTASVFLVPFAANNIYEQQYQMHRFATEYYKKPVAVNDIGYVSFRNENYVLDLYGLSSFESYKSWNSQSGFEWMDSLALKHNVNLIMIYEGWFKEIPKNWRKVAELHLGNSRQITVSDNVVSFFIRDEKFAGEVHDQLSRFRETLPGKTNLILF